MGFYDRDYMRQEGRSYVSSLVPDGRICKWLIAINFVVFVLQLATRSRGMAFDLGIGAEQPWSLTEWLQLVPNRVLHGEVWRLLTYAFVHDTYDFMHVAFNMLFLWWFGSDIETMHGSREFLTFYLVAAFLGGVGETAFLYFFRSPATACLGASGAVTAVMVLYACHFPRRQILVFLILPLPIWAFVAFQVGRDAYVLLSGQSTHVAVEAHLIGAAFGFAYYHWKWRLSSLDFFSRFGSWTRRARRPSLRVYRPDPAEREPIGVAAPTSPSLLDEHLEAKLDAVLEKVARSGKDSLTDEERRILMRASEIYRKRRS